MQQLLTEGLSRQGIFQHFRQSFFLVSRHFPPASPGGGNWPGLKARQTGIGGTGLLWPPGNSAAPTDPPESFFLRLKGHWRCPGGGNCLRLVGKACFFPPWNSRFWRQKCKPNVHTGWVNRINLHALETTRNQAVYVTKAWTAKQVCRGQSNVLTGSQRLMLLQVGC